MVKIPTKAPNSPPDGVLTPRQERALAALLAAPTKREAARMAGIARRTLTTYLENPAFQSAYKAAQADLLEDAAAYSRQQLTGALGTLSTVANDETAPPAARVSAARATVELCLKLIETADIEKRLEALEQAAGGDGH